MIIIVAPLAAHVYNTIRNGSQQRNSCCQQSKIKQAEEKQGGERKNSQPTAEIIEEKKHGDERSFSCALVVLISLKRHSLVIERLNYSIHHFSLFN
jgi:hypothetical protein